MYLDISAFGTPEVNIGECCHIRLAVDKTDGFAAVIPARLGDLSILASWRFFCNKVAEVGVLSILSSVSFDDPGRIVIVFVMTPVRTTKEATPVAVHSTSLSCSPKRNTSMIVWVSLFAVILS